ncbi:MAG: DUF309 domain-containing protein [Kaiparowitsia implicata GSE-PSE-MK54-09C]|jgi:predicted metal-dependent hydrolase|nr:DUF309 domain-containing protein [Kaiparowitsia implicata GSE-PSE-MK54-09C]
MTDAAIAPEFWTGVAEFNQGEYYACHDTLEAIWMEATEPNRSFYQGLLQISVAIYHLSNHNWRGAVILLGEGTHRLRRYQPEYGGVDVDDLLAQGVALMQLLHARGADQAGQVWEQLAARQTAEGISKTAMGNLEVGVVQLPQVRRVRGKGFTTA